MAYLINPRLLECLAQVQSFDDLEKLAEEIVTLFTASPEADQLYLLSDGYNARKINAAKRVVDPQK
ncbi:MAG: hypothetical protein Barrevirus27_8 [Barrevirus sp.]|uniref:Uncharacterized protein n=1 Tax=Barrevirus sp. TaxID=2487763 RepID=A0A3G4ZTE6_9VIRU|nr:MAG: hypothetical protein Barrevirus27_8 [Barrevirus sp.]